MTDASEVPGADVVPWLSRVPSENAATFLIGCSLDDDSSDDLQPIIAFDPDRTAIVVAGGKFMLCPGCGFHRRSDRSFGLPPLEAPL